MENVEEDVENKFVTSQSQKKKYLETFLTNRSISIIKVLQKNFRIMNGPVVTRRPRDFSIPFEEQTFEEIRYRPPSLFVGVTSQEFPANAKTANNKGPQFFTVLTFVCLFRH